MNSPPVLRRAAVCLFVALSCSAPTWVFASGVQTLDTVEVIGKPDDLIGTADSANQGTVGRQQLENRPVLRPGEIAEVVPGLIVTQHSGDGKANQYFLRGFNLDHGTDLSTTVAGMPVNMPTHAHGQGYTDLNFLIPELIERVQYRKGPYYAAEGDFSAAGAVHIDYANKLPASVAELGAGSFGFRRGLLAGSPAYGSGRLVYGVELFGNDGPWDHPEDYRKINTVLRYSEGSATDGFALSAMAYRGKWNATDQIPQRAIDAGIVGRFGALDPTDGGKTHRYSLSGEWARKNESSITKANAYVIDYALDLFSNFTFFLDDPLLGDQFQQSDRRTVAGADVGQTRLGKLFGRDVEHAYGVQTRRDAIGKVALYHTAARDVVATTREDKVQQTGAAIYYQNLLVWTDRLRTLAGVRTDFYRADVRAGDPLNSGTRDDHITSPKLSFILGPWSKTEYYVNVGRGFHSNDARGATDAVAPVTPLVAAKGAELGARTAVVPGVQSSLSLWRLDIDSELVFIGDAGTTEASRPSRRSGIEWANYWKPADWFTGDFDVSVSRARFTDDDPIGDRIPGAIEKTVSLGAVFDKLGPWSGGLRLRYFGPRTLIEDNSVRSHSSTLVNADVGYKLDKRTQVTFEVFNLADVRVSDIDYYYVSRLAGEDPAGVADIHTHPAEPRSVRVAVKYRF